MIGLGARLSARPGTAVVALAAVAFFASAPGQSFFISVFVDDLLADTGITRTTFSLLYAAATVVSATVVLNLGRAIDRVGPGGVWVFVTCGLAAACLVLSVSRAVVGVLVALSLMRAFGQGSFPLIATVLVAARFKLRRGAAMGLATQGLTIAGIVMPALAITLIDTLGWRDALRVIAAALMVLIAPLSVFARTTGRRPATHTPHPGAPASPSARSTLRQPGVRTLLLVLAAAPLITTAIVVHATSVLSTHGIGAAGAAAALSVLAAVTAAGALLAGAMADRLAARWLLAMIGALLTVGTTMLVTHAPALAFLAFAALGLANGMFATANGTLWASSYGTRHLGQLQGLAASVQIAGAAAGPLPLAAVQSLTGGYDPAIVALAALAACAGVMGWRWHAPLIAASVAPATTDVRGPTV